MRSALWIGVPFLFGGALALLPMVGCGSKGKGFADGGGDDSGDLCIEQGICDDADLITDGNTGTTRSLTVVPPNPVLNTTGMPTTQQFTALFTDDMTQDPNADWSLDNVALGTVDKTGLFTAAGNVGGVATIDATDMQASAKGSPT